MTTGKNIAKVNVLGNRMRSPMLYLISSIFSLIITGFLCVPLTPFFIKLFCNFPALDEAKVLHGTVEVVGVYSKFKGPATYFIVNDSGRYVIYCGLPNRRLSCFGSDLWVQGAKGTVWFHEKFGLLQWDLTLQQPKVFGSKDIHSYAVERELFENKFDYHRYLTKFIIMLLSLGVSIYQLSKYFSLKFERNSFVNGGGL